MARRASRVDESQADVVKELRAHGIKVQDLSAVGGGVPDLMLSHAGVTYLCEVIGPSKLKRFPPRGLSPNQVEWHEAWAGEVYCARSVEDAKNIARIIRGQVT